MADLIIKPTSGGALKLQEDGGTDAISIATDGNITFGNSGKLLFGMKVLTSGTSYAKPAGVTALHVTVTGGGGGGASGYDDWNCGGGGGSGGTVISWITGLPSAATSYAYTIGSHGLAGAAADGGNHGTAGTASTFGTNGTDSWYISAGGGGAGQGGGTAGTVAAGGAVSGGFTNQTILLTGSHGGSRGGGGAADETPGANQGGMTIWGGQGPANKNEAGGAGVNYGAGGGGGQNEGSTNRAGANGKAGVIVIYEYK